MKNLIQCRTTNAVIRIQLKRICLYKKLIKMKIIYNGIHTLKGFSAVNLFGILFVKNNVILTDEIIDYESIHIAQMKELRYIFFYMRYILDLCYFINWERSMHNVFYRKWLAKILVFMQIVLFFYILPIIQYFYKIKM